jgi:hypothetical protein
MFSWVKRKCRVRENAARWGNFGNVGLKSSRRKLLRGKQQSTRNRFEDAEVLAPLHTRATRHAV